MIEVAQQQVADAADISRVAYRNIETGASAPRVDTLSAICATLSVSLDDVLSMPPTLANVRFRAQNKLKRRQQVLVDVGRRLRDYCELEDLLDAKAELRFGLPSGRGRKRGVSVAVQAAAEARKAVDLKDGECIRDICGLLEDHGVKVIPVKLASDGFFGLSVGPKDGGPAIAVNVWERISVERWIFSAAHELGHVLLHLNSSFDVEQTEEDPEEEREANAFASRFLMPHDVFLKEWEEARGLSFVDRVVKVKRIFRVSYATVLYRISETQPIGRDIWKKFFGAYQQKFGKSLPRKQELEPTEPGDFADGMSEARSSKEPERLLSSDFRSDRLARLVRDAVEDDKISLGRGAEILGLSVHQMRRRASSWVN